MKVFFLGFVLPDDRFAEFMARETGMPAPTQRFGASVVEALVLGGAEVEVVSAAPATDFPHHRRIWFRGRLGRVRGVNATELPFVNVTGVKHLTRYAAARRALRHVTRRDVILVHGVHSPFLAAALHAGRRTGCNVFVILTDAPSLVTRFDHRASAALKRIDRHVIMHALRRVKGVVTLAPRLAADFAPGVPALSMEGISQIANVDPPSPQEGPPQVVYAGGLNSAYGVSNLLDAVRCSEGDWELHLFGRGPLESEATAKAAQNPRIRVHGLVGVDELGAAYGRASLLVNPRPLDQSLVAYSFPSKLLEYLGTGRPVMTTRLPTIPEDYHQHVLTTPDDAEGMAAAIDRFLAEPAAEREARGQRGRDFVLATRSTHAQGRRLVSFLSGPS